jgi:hypothetical protein
MDHYVRGKGSARPLSMTAKMWETEAAEFRRCQKYNKTEWEYDWSVDRIKSAAHILKRWPCEMTAEVLALEKNYPELKN